MKRLLRALAATTALASTLALALPAAAVVPLLAPPYITWGSQTLAPAPSSLLGYDSGTGAPCIAGSTPTCSIQVAATVSVAGFSQSGVDAKITGGNGSSVNGALTGPGQQAVYNDGSFPAWVGFVASGAGAVAPAGGAYIPAKTTRVLNSGTNGFAAVYGVGGTADVYFTPGTGLPTGWGSAGGGGGGNVNLNQVGGSSYALGQGLMAASISVAIASNQSNVPINEAQINGVTPLMGNGVSGTGSQRVNIASDNTPFGVLPQAGTTGGCTPYHLAGGSAASNNSTLISTGAHTLCKMTPVNTTPTIYYLKLYDSAGAPTCSSATGIKHVYPIPANTSGAGFMDMESAFGEAYASGLGFCVTGGGADTDNTNAATGVYIEASYK